MCLIKASFIEFLIAFFSLYVEKMPYSLLKVSPRRYYVINLDTGKRYSKEPLTKEKAEKQLIALRINTKH